MPRGCSGSARLLGVGFGREDRSGLALLGGGFLLLGLLGRVLWLVLDEQTTLLSLGGGRRQPDGGEVGLLRLILDGRIEA